MWLGSYAKSGEILSGVMNLKIGELCAIGRNRSMQARTHGVADPVISMEAVRNQKVEKDIMIGDRVWIGDNVFIRKGVTIGDNAFVGANSVVMHSAHSKTVVARVVSQKIKMLL